jgi:hypothetical protein
MMTTRILISALMAGSVALVTLLPTAGAEQKKGGGKTKRANATTSGAAASVEFTPFGELNGRTEYNASGIVPLADGRFLFVENNVNDALMELALDASGVKQGRLVRRPLTGAGPLDDLEAVTLATIGSKPYVLAITSLSNARPKKGGGATPRPAALLRITSRPTGTLVAEPMAGFRDWFLANCPLAAQAAGVDPDRGGLNVEGLAWSPAEQSLLIGLRTPTAAGRPAVVPIRVIDTNGPWSTANLEVRPPIVLRTAAADGQSGIRSLEYDPVEGQFLVCLGNAESNSTASFRWYWWSGGSDGQLQAIPGVTFAPRAKPEGVTFGKVGGRDALVLVDDGGGYAVIWRDDARLRQEARE